MNKATKNYNKVKYYYQVFHNKEYTFNIPIKNSTENCIPTKQNKKRQRKNGQQQNV